MALRVAADVELLAVRYLRGRNELEALVGQRVYTELPAEPVFPTLVVRRVGGSTGYLGWLDIARLQIDAWSTTKYDARLVAATALAALQEMPGKHDEGVVSHVVQDLGLSWLPDPDTDRPRYIFGVAVYVHPNT